MKQAVVITGVGKGFGDQLLRHFSKEYHVIGLTRSQNDIDRLTIDHSLNDRSISLHAVDVSEFEEVKKIIDRYIADGRYTIYGLINNAGVRCRSDFLKMDVQKFEEVAKVNLFAPINLSRLIIPTMLENRIGRIINISSILSTSALPELSAYATSKAGLDGFTRSIAVEYAAHGITCNSILPGFCETSYFQSFRSKTDLYQMTLDRTPAKRWGKDSELIGLCDLLLGEDGGYINGASIPIDGGWMAS
jgi:NAD(P)-dependent dehydrogenase (short-subunit alcohol dehydrogenase family)